MSIKSLFSIRKKKHAKHPQVIVGANRTSFDSMSLTHSRGKRKARNKKLMHNPNPLDKDPAYVSRRIINDFKFNFSKSFKNYQLSNEDIDELKRFLETKKRK